MSRAMYDGDRERLRRALAGMIAGEPSIVGVIGGSISQGIGAFETGRGYAGAWVSRLRTWLEGAFPQGNVQVANGAIGGRGSTFMAVCAKAAIPLNADLVFIELAINDPQSWTHDFQGESRRSFERMLRKLLELPHRPAIVLLNSYSWFQAGSPPGTYYQNAEAAYFEFATYYGLPLISTKAAVYHLMTAGVKGFSVATTREKQDRSNASLPTDELYYSDRFHPAADTGARATADMAIYSLMRVMRDLDAQPFQAHERQYVDAPLPAPVLADNLALSSDTCFLGDALQATFVDATGFEWVNEAPNSKFAKWGYTGTAVGSRIGLLLKAPTAGGGEGPGIRQHNITIYVSFLRSYEHMGIAQVTCGPGCTCPSGAYDGHHPEYKDTQLHMLGISATMFGDCTLSITILSDTTSGEHKVKIGGLMVSEAAVSGTLMSLGDALHDITDRFSEERVTTNGKL